MNETQQPITPELRQWLAQQVAAGHPRDAVLEAMRASGWNEPSASAAFEEFSTGARDDVANPTNPTNPANPANPMEQAQPRPDLEPARVQVPEPLPNGTCATLRAADRDILVLASLRAPRIVVFGNLLSSEECDELIELARHRLARSETVHLETGDSEVNDARTSEGMFFDRGEQPVVARLEARIAALLRWPLEHGEGLQVLRYGRDAEYKPHYDYFDPVQTGTPAILKRGGQRVASLVCYLNSPARGGATTFPDARFEVAPVKGNAVFFSYDRPDPATGTLHGGAPVEEGEKWVATKWLREGVFV